MILQRFAAAIRRQDWFVVVVEFVVVVAGIFVALQVDRWNEQRNREQRGDRVIATIRDDLLDRAEVEKRFLDRIEVGLAAWEDAYARGELPPPYYFRVDGAETPPNDIWDAITKEGVTDLLHPSLVFDLGFYYSESRGIGLRYVRYAEFTEAEVLPWIGDPDETIHFYRDDRTLRPEFRGHMDRLAEYGEWLDQMRSWSVCLLQRLETPQLDSADCRQHPGTSVLP